MRVINILIKYFIWIHRCDGVGAEVNDEITNTNCDAEDENSQETPTLKDKNLCTDEAEQFKGNAIQRDIDTGKSINITCSSGCLKITKAMYSCVADSGVMVPGHMELLQSRCDGRGECYAEACDSFWNTNLRCASFDKSQLWIHYR